jgi:hypothetical protein
MALIFDRKVPAGIIDKARSTLGDLAAVPDSRGGQSPLAKATVSNTPLPVYSLRLDALAGGLGPWDAGLADAEPESWRVFVMMNGRNEPTGVADVTSSPGEAGGARFLSYTRGPQVAASGQVLTDAEDAEPLRSRTFQPGFLEIPGINVSAVWLKALDGLGDVVIPVDPIPRFLSDRRNYTLREFLELARARAVQRLKFNNSPRVDGPNPPLAQAPHPDRLQDKTVALGPFGGEQRGEMAGPFPTYQTALLRDYSLPLRDLADRIFGYVKGAEPSCARREGGSYSVDASSCLAGEEKGRTAAKIVIIERGRGKRSPELHSLVDGVYILVRSTDPLGGRIWGSRVPHDFAALFALMKRDEMMAVSPRYHVGFSYFLFNETRYGVMHVADMLVACGRL